ncbi:hypothetical protein N7454_005216 [Penicillium verhagenii]|nr:hypothetical protein N7454_005216 [Penicillium verhagenii]
MQLQSLRDIRAEKEIRSELSRTPRDLTALYHGLYGRALETIQENRSIRIPMVARVRESHGTSSLLGVLETHSQNDEDSDTADT